MKITDMPKPRNRLGSTRRLWTQRFLLLQNFTDTKPLALVVIVQLRGAVFQTWVVRLCLPDRLPRTALKSVF